jgi:hypothetical protein
MLSLVLSLSLLLTLSVVSLSAEEPFKDWPEGYLTGMVRDADGKPIKGAKILLNNREGPSGTRGGNWAFTGADGKYALRVFIKPDSQVIVKDVIVSAKGFVQSRERFILDEVILLPGKKTGGELRPGPRRNVGRQVRLSADPCRESPQHQGGGERLPLLGSRPVVQRVFHE